MHAVMTLRGLRRRRMGPEVAEETEWVGRNVLMGGRGRVCLVFG